MGAEKDLSRFYEEFHRVQDHAQNQVRKIPFTTASRGHASGPKKKAMLSADDEKELFKLTKFKKISAKVKTQHRKFRDDTEISDTEFDYAGSNDGAPLEAPVQSYSGGDVGYHGGERRMALNGGE